MNKIISISREFGSGGRELGKRLADKLGFAYYDKEIVQEIANRSELSLHYVNDVIEHRPSFSFPIHTGVSFMMTDSIWNPTQTIYSAQCEILREMAEKSDCVVVGRCSDYILREFKPLKLFVYAEMEHKIARCREKKPDETRTDRQLARMIKNIDKHRAKYYEFFTARRWGNKRLYDICINTSEISVKDVASVLADYVHLWNPSEN